jgi:hypothetical protein
MLGTGLGVLVTGIVLGGLFGRNWEQRQVEKYLGQQGGHASGSDATLIGWMELRSGGQGT